MKKIPLTKGLFALVDDADYEWLNQWKWCIGSRGNLYAQSTINSKNYLMHRFILGLKHGDKRQGDHKDKNTFNNQRSNLRICTHAQNLQNSRKYINGKSRFKGVTWDKVKNKWAAQISGKAVKKKFLGYYDSDIVAAFAYDKAARQNYGEFARPNFTMNDIAIIKQITDEWEVR